MRREHIERLLPAGFQRAAEPGSILAALLDVMELLHAPSELTLEHVDDLAAGYRAPDRLLPFLVRWVAFDHLTGGGRVGQDSTGGLPIGRLRDLVANAASLSAARGTAAGLSRLLTIVSGIDGFRVDEPADAPFHIVVVVPPAAAPQIDLIRRVVATEKPAATTSEVVVLDPTPTA
jgi:phage tail-like protein